MSTGTVPSPAAVHMRRPKSFDIKPPPAHAGRDAGADIAVPEPLNVETDPRGAAGVAAIFQVPLAAKKRTRGQEQRHRPFAGSGQHAAAEIVRHKTPAGARRPVRVRGS